MRVVGRWQAVDGADRYALEMEGAIDGIGRLAAHLRSSADDDRATASFLILSLDRRSGGQIQDCIDGVDAAALPVHVCLVVDPGALQTPCRMPLSGRVGLMLDAADAVIPFAAMADERIEAVRFGESHAATFASSLRSACVSRAMIRLARELGLATLGCLPVGSVGRTCEAEFDYVLNARPVSRRVHSTVPPDFELSR